MYSILVVDDEVWIRERIARKVPWADIGAEVVGQAADGEEALELALELQPDIILTDIRMPGMTGLELIERLRAEKSSAKIVIISGYDDFAYAQQALRLGAAEYVLKPVENAQLLEVAQRCIAKINHEHQQQSYYQKLYRQIEHSAPAARSGYLLKWLSGSYSSDEELRRRVADVGEEGWLQALEEKPLHLCDVLEIDGYDAVAQDAYWNRALLSYVLQNIAQDCYAPLGTVELLGLSADHLVVLLSGEAASEDAFYEASRQAALRVQQEYARITGATLTIGLGGVCDSLWEAPASFYGAQQALQRGAFLGRGRLYGIERPEITQSAVLDTAEFADALEQGDVAVVDKAVGALCSQLAAGAARPDLIGPYMQASLVLLAKAEKLPDGGEFALQYGQRLLEHLSRLENTEGLAGLLREETAALLASGEKTQDGTPKAVQQALRYIAEHYREGLSLNAVAGELFLNPSYFCKIFRQSTGLSFTRYLQRYRVEKAQQLMRETKLKMYEIGEAVGYEDAQYFSKIFKQVTGETPLQYSESH